MSLLPNSLFYSDTNKLLIKVFAKTTKELCKLITAPTTPVQDTTAAASSGNITTDGSKPNVVMQSVGQAYEEISKQQA